MYFEVRLNLTFTIVGGMSSIVDLNDSTVIDLDVVCCETQVLSEDFSSTLDVEEAPGEVEHVLVRMRLVAVDVRSRLHDGRARDDIIKRFPEIRTQYVLNIFTNQLLGPWMYG